MTQTYSNLNTLTLGKSENILRTVRHFFDFYLTSITCANKIRKRNSLT